MRFTKYNGLGNDFIIVDLRGDVSPQQRERIQDPSVVRLVCDRRFGVGGDGVLAILPASPQADIAADSERQPVARMRVLNADGSEAEMCGNGLRCVVKHLYERDPALRRPRFAVDTGAGSLLCEITSDGDIAQTVTVDMGRPRLGLSEIPMSPSALSPDAGATADGARFVAQPLSAAGRELSATAVSMGNPHVISFVSESSSALRTVAETIGPAVETHPWFPEKTNVEFAHVHSPNEIELVVWERGCGITLACGTGACATAVAACLTGQARAGEEIRVRLLGGDLQITVDHDLRTVHMRGPATRVFDAEFAPSFLASAR